MRPHDLRRLFGAPSAHGLPVLSRATGRAGDTRRDCWRCGLPSSAGVKRSVCHSVYQSRSPSLLPVPLPRSLCLVLSKRLRWTGLAHTIPVPQTFTTGDLVATPLPSITHNAAQYCGFVWVAPPAGTRAGMTLCVTIRVKYDQDLRRRVEAYKRVTQPGAGPASVSASVIAAQNRSKSEEDESSTEDDSSYSDNESESRGDAAAQQRAEAKDSSPATSGGVSETPAGASRTASAAAFVSSYLEAANMSDLVSMRASFRNGRGAPARQSTKTRAAAASQRQPPRQQELLGGGQHRHGKGSLVGGFAPSGQGGSATTRRHGVNP